MEYNGDSSKHYPPFSLGNPSATALAAVMVEEGTEGCHS